MISIEEAQARIFALKETVETEILPLGKAAGRWVADDVIARRSQPACDMSAMDGYAVRFATGDTSWTVIGESAAGRRFSGTLQTGEAVRIFTGALIPDGADTVIMQENIALDGAIATLIDGEPKREQHVRVAGGDFSAGTILVPKGAELHARHIALAAMAGHGELPVFRPIRVALVSTGDELVAPGLACADDQIPSSNGIMLATMLRDLPVELTEYANVADNLEELSHLFRDISEHDIIVTTGGASVGDHDLVGPALIAAGGEIDFWKIAMRPGKPVFAGRIGAAAVLGLPGNPVSAYVTAFLFLRPLIAKLSGALNPLPRRLTAQLGSDLPSNGVRTDHLRANLADGILTPVGVNDSAMLCALSISNTLIIRNINEKSARQGDLVEYYPLW